MKLRIVSGELGGRSFKSPPGNRTHPMSEKIRGAVFNILGDVSGKSVLDTFAGSGAVSFEALSRGAKNAFIVEENKSAYETIRANIEQLNLSENSQLIKGNIKSWSKNNQNRKFDIVICDPPYDQVLAVLIEKLAIHVAPKGLLVLSWPTDADLPQIADFKIVKQKEYGNAALVFYHKTG